MTGKPRTQNSHGRLSRLKHLENLGLNKKTERKGQTTEGQGLILVKTNPKHSNQAKKIPRDTNMDQKLQKQRKP